MSKPPVILHVSHEIPMTSQQMTRYYPMVGEAECTAVVLKDPSEINPSHANAAGIVMHVPTAERAREFLQALRSHGKVPKAYVFVPKAEEAKARQLEREFIGTRAEVMGSFGDSVPENFIEAIKLHILQTSQ